VTTADNTTVGRALSEAGFAESSANRAPGDSYAPPVLAPDYGLPPWVCTPSAAIPYVLQRRAHASEGAIEARSRDNGSAIVDGPTIAGQQAVPSVMGNVVDCYA
jgi:hypothetical protein